MRNIEHAEAEIDARLTELYKEMQGLPPAEMERVVACVRAAWALGVRDAFAEPDEIRALYARNGFHLPGD